MKFTLRGASSAALLLGLAGSLPAWAQDTVSGPQPPAEESGDSDRVVVTGSFIQGTPEDAALPVEVFTQEELEQQGAPTALEFAKSLTISGPTTGEAYYFSGAALTGSVNYNLRGLGSDKTLVLLNGRRMSQNTSNIPSAAIARTEVEAFIARLPVARFRKPAGQGAGLPPLTVLPPTLIRVCSFRWKPAPKVPRLHPREKAKLRLAGESAPLQNS